MACTNKLLKDKAALKSKMIEVILVNKAGVIDEYSGIASNNEISPIKSIQEFYDTSKRIRTFVHYLEGSHTNHCTILVVIVIKCIVND